MVAQVSQAGRMDIGILADGEGTIEGLLETESYEGYSQISPDGRWLAYVLVESGAPEIYVRRFPT